MLAPDRAARLVEQSAIDASLPGLGEVVDSLVSVGFRAAAATPYEAEVQRAVQRIIVDELVDVAGGAAMAQVRAVATYKLREIATDMGDAEVVRGASATAQVAAAHSMLLADDIRRFLERGVTAVAPRFAAPTAPPGAPIGEPTLDWLRAMEPPCMLMPWMLQ
jgi:hypothetical protein